MFRAEPLVRIRLLMLASEAPDAALELARFGVFSPAAHTPPELAESLADPYREAWLDAESRVSKLVERCGNMGELIIPEGAAAPTLADLDELNTWLKGVWNTCLSAHEGEARIQEEIRHLDALEDTLTKLERLNVDLAQLLRADGLLAVNIGSAARPTPSSPVRATVTTKCVACSPRRAGANCRYLRNCASTRRPRAPGWRRNASAWRP